LNSSTNQAPDESIKIGYIRRAHGIKGAVIVRVLGDETDRFAVGSVLSTDNGRYPDLTLLSSQPHPDGLLVVFEEVADRNESEQLRGTSFLISADQRRNLDDDEFWPEQLVGMRAVNPAGEQLGGISDLITGDAQDRLVIATAAGTFEVPFVSAIVTKVDVGEGIVVVDAPEGLLEP
jgi:16S rRNA processing protein RimM